MVTEKKIPKTRFSADLEYRGEGGRGSRGEGGRGSRGGGGEGVQGGGGEGVQGGRGPLPPYGGTKIKAKPCLHPHISHPLAPSVCSNWCLLQSRFGIRFILFEKNTDHNQNHSHNQIHNHNQNYNQTHESERSSHAVISAI